MTIKSQLRSGCKLLSGAAALLCAAAAPAAAVVPAPACAVRADVIRLGTPLRHVAGRIAAGLPVRIVAVGSSSTAGAGASSSAFSYPSRLELELKGRFPRASIVVLNRGVNGEEVGQMLARFGQAVMAEKPDLVIWQVGTNALLRDQDLGHVADLLRRGLDRLKTLAADVIVIDPQFAPKVIAKPGTGRMLELLSSSAKLENVGYFHRYAIMRAWSETDHLAFEQFVAPDGLHMNDWSYACMAKLLAGAITEAVTRVQQTAHAGIEQH
jgi:lysophospholipase L1-like esterase